MKCYINIITNEVVYKEEAKEYVFNKLGLTVTPKGNNGEMTLEQIENIEQTVNWYFSGNWIEEDYIEDNKQEDRYLKYLLEKDDEKYQEEICKRLIIEE